MIVAAGELGADIVSESELVVGKAIVVMWLGSGDEVVSRASPVLIEGPFLANSLSRSSAFKSSSLTH
jgi:hypothetical protein